MARGPASGADMRETNRQATPEFEPPWQVQLSQQLAADLATGKLELPSFPDIVIRIRQALADEDASFDKVARVVGSEPALAARMLRLANSVALNRSGNPVTDLKMAISRMGVNLVRTSALSFAMNQIRQSDTCQDFVDELGAIWERATLVAAVTHAVARRVPGVNEDEAMLAGLLHSVGKLYILLRAARYEGIAGDEGALAQIMVRWHAEIGAAILKGWALPDEICEAVAWQYDIDEGRTAARVTLADVLATGIVVADYLDDLAGLELATSGSRWFGRLGLDAAACVTVLGESRDEILEIKRMLGG